MRGCQDRGSFQRFSSSGAFIRRLSSGAGIWSIGGAAAGAGAAEREGEAEAAGVSEDADVELGEGLQRRASGLRGFKPCCEREEYVRKKSYTNGRSDKDSDLKPVSSLDQVSPPRFQYCRPPICRNGQPPDMRVLFRWFQKAARPVRPDRGWN